MITDVWSCGGGVQSCAIGVLIIQGKLQKPDLAIIVDTERERSSTWAYYDNTLRPALADVGVDVVRVPKSAYATCDLWGGEDDDLFLPGGFFKGQKAPMFCSNEWKSRVVTRWMRAQGVKQARMWMGMSTDEMSRVRVSRIGWIEKWYPLIDHRMSRTRCIEAVVKHGWPMPPRSSCWMCPNAGDRDWLALKREWPEDFARAVALERDIRSVQPEMTLHASGNPLDTVDFGDAQMTIGEACDGMCWV